MTFGNSLCFGYDSLNRLTFAGDHDYVYNAENVRMRNLCTDEDTTYVYNTNCKLSQLLVKTTNGVTTKYVYGLGLIGEEANNTFKTYHFDSRGSTIAITDASGNITDTFAYDTYGKLLTRTGTNKVIFGYNGRDGVVTDKNGLIYMRARYYSPNMRRFINADIIAGEISNAITLNRYAYANGNPVSFIDPFGLSPWSWFKEKVLEPVGKGLAKAGKAVVDHVVKPIVNNVVKPVLDIGQKAFDYIATDFGEDIVENVLEPASTFVEDKIMSPISEDVKAVDNWFDDVGDWLNKNALNSDGSYSLHDSLRNRRRKQGQTVLREQLLAFTPSDPSWNWSAEDFSVGLGSLSVDAMTGGWEGEYANLSLLDFGHAEVGLELKNGKFNVSTMASIWSPSFSVNIFGVNIKIGAEVGAVGLAAKGQFSAGKKEVGFSIGGGVGFSFNASW